MSDLAQPASVSLRRRADRLKARADALAARPLMAMQEGPALREDIEKLIGDALDALEEAERHGP